MIRTKGFIGFLIFLGLNFQFVKASNSKTPRIFNIVNFIRNTDYRVDNSEALLYQTVVNQIKLVDQYHFPATFLFQYDALINPQYQQLMKTRLPSNCEIGAWWEITQPQVEAAGLVWRGEHSWVSTANVAFTPGYTQSERKKLVDVYMLKFKEIYGHYPTAVGSWFIDSYTIRYMYQRYHIVASCNCKDQVGTDGYTLWGGYWNQAYYPSLTNAYMPAQTKDKQIPVPIFRMLGSDPMYQYDSGIGSNYQHVISLEPVYPSAGKNSKWVDYFIQSIVNEPCLSFNYAQVGQENSFTWDAMSEGLFMQFRKLDSLTKQSKIKLETLTQSGIWFKNNFELTPPTAVTTMKDFNNQDNKSIWYNSRYYRINLYWEKSSFCIRDIHLFNENFQSAYFEMAGTGHQFLYFTLPFVDRFFWSTSQNRIGLRIIKISLQNQESEVVLNHPKVKEISKSILEIRSSDSEGNKFIITLRDRKMEVRCKPKEGHFRWIMELRIPTEKLNQLPFLTIEKNQITAKFNGFNYFIPCSKGYFIRGENANIPFQIIPEKDRIVLLN